MGLEDDPKAREAQPSGHRRSRQQHQDRESEHHRTPHRAAGEQAFQDPGPFRWPCDEPAHDEERLTYMKDEDAVFRAVAAGDCEMAILLNPPKITEVKDVARAGDRMPHKSTYFYPKPLTGLVINKMD